ncbi:MAG: hypothetical protein P0Y56_13560 [Candidatus Andeanibacterium colombiense]|uniref:Outer membrane lipoprotein BamD-like domain-containing protein n=1 Tax=Candidatus Andeanibacterium colombiense TaxID=3121345 RepID=A0AAJ5X8J0_9SPHN|nr:MAG: hypothetical protein P0Y56_13560 [Sphingomonadaceae bacterium]
MVTGIARMRRKVVVLALLGSGLTLLPSIAHAQDQDARLRKIESEIKAIQRTVFPGGDGRFFTPEVTTAQQAAADSGLGGGNSTSAVTDILGRLDSLETQLRQLTSQNEENTHAIAQINARLDALDAAARQAAVAAAPITAPPPPGLTLTPSPAPAPVRAAPAPTPAAAPAPTPTPAPSAARVAAVQAIVKPVTADPGDDEYTYGFRLWEAKFYPEAVQQLQLFVQKYPKHPRISFARNLLGRAYLDQGKVDDAATWFVANYTAGATGERAPDSLLYLSEAMIAKGDTKRACLALAEFSEVYPALATGRLQGQYRADTARVKCN